MKITLFKVSLILAGFPAITLSAREQAMYDCIYQYDVNGTTGNSVISTSTNCILRIGEETSKFSDYAAFQLDSVSAIPGIADEIIQEYQKKDSMSENYFDLKIFTSSADAMQTVSTLMTPYYYKYDEKIPEIIWNQSDETATVCGYECKKATGEYGGRVWTVWYAEEIPVPYGPWKLYGLPGLIMKASDNEGNHTFSAISFRQATGEISPEKIPNMIKTDHKTFEERKYDYDKDSFSTINPQDITQIEVKENKTVYVNGFIIRKKENGFIPLEISDYTKREREKSKNDTGSIKVVEIGTM